MMIGDLYDFKDRLRFKERKEATTSTSRNKQTNKQKCLNFFPEFCPKVYVSPKNSPKLLNFLNISILAFLFF